jgi:uncharacterized membrane protein
MKTIYLFLLVSFATFANNPKNENPNPTRNTISGLKIVSYDSQKNGKHIYVVSDIYTKKKITFYNNEGDKVFSTKTVGSAIYLSQFKKGKYTVKIVEGKKQEIKEFTVE